MRLIDADAIPYIDLNSDMPQSKVRVWIAFKDKIDRIPTIESEQKKGKWILHAEWQADGECGYECSVCGMCSDVDYAYCQFCGADMRGGAE